MARAGLDEHHVAVEAVSLGAAELHLGRGGGLGHAAAAVRAGATELGPVRAHATATRQLEAHATGAPRGPDTLLPLLWRHQRDTDTVRWSEGHTFTIYHI